MKNLAILLSLFGFLACEPAAETTTATPETEVEDAYSDFAKIAGEAGFNEDARADLRAIRDRIRTEKERLTATPAGTKVWEAIAAHGGLQSLYWNEFLGFQFNYRPEPGEKGNVRNTYSYNNYVTTHTYHEALEDESGAGVFGYDADGPWSMTGEKVDGMSPAFWAKTPYYFVGIPFVLGGEGINFEDLGPTEMDGNQYDQIKVTYEANVGDAPDDYYVLHLNRATKQVDAMRYIVSYPGFFPDGGHNPEKLMKLKGTTEVDGLILPTGYDTYWWNEGQPGTKITDITISDYQLGGDIGMDPFVRPNSATAYKD